MTCLGIGSNNSWGMVSAAAAAVCHWQRHTAARQCVAVTGVCFVVCATEASKRPMPQVAVCAYACWWAWQGVTTPQGPAYSFLLPVLSPRSRGEALEHCFSDKRQLAGSSASFLAQ